MFTQFSSLAVPEIFKMKTSGTPYDDFVNITIFPFQWKQHIIKSWLPGMSSCEPWDNVYMHSCSRNWGTHVVLNWCGYSRDLRNETSHWNFYCNIGIYIGRCPRDVVSDTWGHSWKRMSCRTGCISMGNPWRRWEGGHGGGWPAAGPSGEEMMMLNSLGPAPNGRLLLAI